MQLNPIVYHLAIDGAIKKLTGSMEDSSSVGAIDARAGAGLPICFEFLVSVRRERLGLNSLHQPY